MARRMEEAAQDAPPEADVPPAESPPADVAPPITPAPEVQAEAAPAGYFVADGYTTTSLRGTLRGGEEVFPRDFHMGVKQLDELVASGALVRR